MLALVDHAGSNLNAQVHRALENASKKHRNAVVHGLNYMASGDFCGLASYCVHLPNGYTDEIAAIEERRAAEAGVIEDEIDDVSSLRSPDSFGSPDSLSQSEHLDDDDEQVALVSHEVVSEGFANTNKGCGMGKHMCCGCG
jgi:hypothetical protein